MREVKTIRLQRQLSNYRAGCGYLLLTNCLPNGKGYSNATPSSTPHFRTVHSIAPRRSWPRNPGSRAVRSIQSAILGDDAAVRRLLEIRRTLGQNTGPI